MAYSFNAYDYRCRLIDNVRFSILNNEETYNMSVLKSHTNPQVITQGVKHEEFYEIDNKPKRDGIMDRRLGVVDDMYICDTCGYDSSTCHGHYAHVRLSLPIFNPMFIKYLKKVLSCICLQCSRVPLSNKQKQIILNNNTSLHKLDITANLTKSIKVCLPNKGCNAPKTKIKISKSINYLKMESITPKSTIELSPSDVYKILRHVTDDDCRVLGFDPTKMRPEAMIYVIFPISPISIRPSIKMSSSSMPIVDDLTHGLKKIIAYNNMIEKNMNDISGDPLKQIKYHKNLMLYTALYLSGDVEGKASGQNTKRSLIYRFKGKDGRIRQNLDGKRTNGTARTVITPDPNIEQNQLGVPVRIAKILTIPETVTPKNIKYLQELVRNGSSIYPGANNVYILSNKQFGEKVFPIELNERNKYMQISHGDVVSRHLIDGDIVLLNRQPTLHRSSMMSHRIKVINDDTLLTFRLNPCVVTPYNADFDGDEMNIFVPQSMMSISELALLTDARRQFISPKTSSVILSMIQDSVIGSYLMTKYDDFKLTKTQVMNMLAATDIKPSTLVNKLNKDIYTSKDLFNCLLDPSINIRSKHLDIDNGVITRGHVDGKMLGGNSNGLLRSMLDNTDYITTSSFVNNIQKITNIFNTIYGYTLGMQDLMIPDTLRKQINVKVHTEMTKVQHFITEIENTLDPDVEVVDRRIMEYMNTIRDGVSQMLKGQYNSFLELSKEDGMANAKGSLVNYCQSVAYNGPIAMNGKLLERKINQRCMPYFHKYDDTPRARGNIESSYVKGVDLIEYYYDTMIGRAGIINSNIKTADTGYTQRKIVKATENLTIDYYGRVIDTNNKIYQFVYGSTAYDCMMQNKTKSSLLTMDNHEIDNMYRYNKQEISQAMYMANESFVNQLRQLLITFRRDQLLTDYRTPHNVMPNEFSSPVNLAVYIKNYTIQVAASEDDKPSVTYIIDGINKLVDNIQVSIYKALTSFANDFETTYKLLPRYLLMEYLAPKRVREEYKFTKDTFDRLCTSLLNAHNKALVNPGENVGIIIAHSIGESLTQDTLNTIHKAGVNAIRGAPRVKEIMVCTTNMKHPQTIIYPKAGTSEKEANSIKSSLTVTYMRDLIDKCELIYLGETADDIPDDLAKEVTTMPIHANSHDNMPSVHTPWLYKIHVNHKYMYYNELSITDIKHIIAAVWYNRTNYIKLNPKNKSLIDKIIMLYTNTSDNVSDDMILHIGVNFESVNEDILRNFYTNVIQNIKIKGLTDIDNVELTDFKGYISVDEQTGDISKTTMYAIACTGNNVRDIFYYKNIDVERVFFNDFMLIYETFGIEAAYTIIVNEYRVNFESPINVQHFALLADLMCHSGIPISIDRHGVVKLDNSPFMRSSFEVPISHLTDAAVYAQTDTMQSATSRVMTGHAIKSGTGAFHLSIDNDMMVNSKAIKYKQMKSTRYNFVKQTHVINKNIDIYEELLINPSI